MRLGTGIFEVEDDGGGHGRGHRGGRRPAKQTDREESGADDLRRRGRERPERRRAGKEAEKLLHDVRAEAVDVHHLVDAVVDHERAPACELSREFPLNL